MPLTCVGPSVVSRIIVYRVIGIRLMNRESQCETAPPQAIGNASTSIKNMVAVPKTDMIRRTAW